MHWGMGMNGRPLPSLGEYLPPRLPVSSTGMVLPQKDGRKEGRRRFSNKPGSIPLWGRANTCLQVVSWVSHRLW